MTAAEISALVSAVVGLLLALTAWLRAEVANRKTDEHERNCSVKSTETATTRPSDNELRQ